MESVYRRALRLLEEYVLVSRLTARGDVDIWVFLIKKFHICDSIGDVHDSITYCLLLTRSYTHLSCGPLERVTFYSCGLLEGILRRR